MATVSVIADWTQMERDLFASEAHASAARVARDTRILVAEAIRALPPEWFMRAPLVPRMTQRPVALIVADIRRATVPALRPEDV